MFKRGEVIAVGASGGKDSTVLIHLLHLLNEKFDYGIQLHMLAVDDGTKDDRTTFWKRIKEIKSGMGFHLLL